jgi:branched-chain amino acid transport system permease protein
VLEQLYNALFLGSIYALFALGFTLVFGVLDILNLAHPAVFMLGAFVALALMTSLHLPAVLAVLAAFLVTGLVGIGLDRVCFAPLRRRQAPPLAAMITSLGMALIFVSLVQRVFGPDVHGYPTGSVPHVVISLGSLRLDALRLGIIALSLLLMAALTAVVQTTGLGRAIRAVAENARAARLLGVNVDRVIAATFFISSGLGGLAGVLLGFALNGIDPQMGRAIELKGLSVIIVGGMGSIPGAVLGGYLLGLGETASFVALPTELRDLFAFGLLFFILLVRPSGLLGRKPPERV